MKKKKSVLPEAGIASQTFVFRLIVNVLIMTAVSVSVAVGQTVRLAFYNVENYFDYEDDPGKDDSSFLPESPRQWTASLYRRKSRRIYKVIANLGNPEPPALVGLAEIENRRALDDLRCRTALARVRYQVVHFESPDRRGIDVALLFRPQSFRLINAKALPVKGQDWRSRDILYASGTLPGGDTLHVYVNHWPSRWAGQKASEPRRLVASEILRKHVSALLFQNPKAKIVIMGDFNDDPENLSITKLQAGLPVPLANLMVNDLAEGRGTHTHTETATEWSVLDQILVSRSLMEGSSWKVLKRASHIFSPDWLLRDGKPYRFFRGTMATGGFSDHLPVFLDIKRQ
ncbi:endonuclease/exonuclease/phosphatase family protein [Fulvitalea axinellae]